MTRRTDGPAAAHEARHVLLVSSAGGHLSQLVVLRPWWELRRRTWITFDTADTMSRLVGEDVVYARQPTTRNIPNLVRNTFIALRVLVSRRPDLIVSTGAAVAIPCFLLGRLLGVPCAYIEVVDRVSSRTVTGRLCYRLGDRFLVQWPEQQRLYPRSLVVGTLI